MQFTFPADKSIEMTFKVGIAGTASPPSSVMVVLERDGKSLSYSAHQLGDDWTAKIDQPGKTFGTGSVKLSVNVILRERIFTPFKTIADIVDVAAPEFVVPQTPAPVETPEPVTEPEVQTFDIPQAAVPTAAAAVVVPAAAPAPTMESAPPLTTPAKRLSILKSLEPEKKVEKKAAEPVKVAVKESAPEGSPFSLKKVRILFK